MGLGRRGFKGIFNCNRIQISNDPIFSNKHRFQTGRKQPQPTSLQNPLVGKFSVEVVGRFSEVSMDVLFFVFFQATVRALAADPTDTAALKPVLGLRAGDDLEHLGCLEFVVGVEFAAKIGWRNTMLFLFLSLFSYFFP